MSSIKFTATPVQGVQRLFYDHFSGGTNSNKASTGAAIFGSSPVPSNPVMPPSFGQPAERETSTPTSISKVQGVQPNEDNFKVSQPNTSGWAELWPQESKRNINANSMKNEASSNKLTSSMKNMEDTLTSESSNLPINPFTGKISCAEYLEKLQCVLSPSDYSL